MEFFLANLHWFLAMVFLAAVSSYCSGTESVMFYLRASDRKLLAAGTEWQKRAAALLDDPDRLLGAILFCNLLVNSSYFAIAAIIGLHLSEGVEGVHSQSLAFGVGSLLFLIFCGEMVPKCIGVLGARSLAPLMAVPISVMARLLDPVLPALSTITLLSRRVLWPSFEAEPYLEVADLERAVEYSTDDAQLIAQEQLILGNLVRLSELRADELMRPRTQYVAFRPPVRLSDLQGRLTRSGYLLVTEEESDEIVAALNLRRLAHIPRGRLDRHATPVLYVPWSATVAGIWESLRSADHEVAAVVNEFGETIGILTLDDIVDSLLTPDDNHSERLPGRLAISELRPGVWQVTGMTSIRRLATAFEVELPPTKNVTVAGILQEQLQRFPYVGDACTWGPFQFRVVASPERGIIVVELERAPTEEAAP